MSEKQVVAMLGGRPVLGKAQSRLEVADAIARGLPQKALEHVKQALQLTDGETAALLGMSTKTISRLRGKPRHLLDAVASDRLYRMALLFARAEEVFEDEELAREWLRAPQLGLKQRVPLELMATEAGAREVEALLGRIEYGVLS